MEDVSCVDSDNVDLPAFFASDEPENDVYCLFSNFAMLFLRVKVTCRRMNTNVILICNSNPGLRVTSKRRRNLKTEFISPVTPTVHTNPSRNPSFSRTLFKPELFENARFSFSCGHKHFKNGDFKKRWRHDNHVISLTEFSSSTNPKLPVIAVF